MRRLLLALIIILIPLGAEAADSLNTQRTLKTYLSAVSVAYGLSTTDAIAAKIDTTGTGTPVVVFNPLMWKRTDYVIVKSPFNNETTKFISATDGTTTFPAQIFGDEVVFTARDVPALGYKVFWLKKSENRVTSAVTGSDNSIENDFFRITIDPDSGAISGIYDKLRNREIVPQNQQAGVLKLREEKTNATKVMNDAKGSVMIETGPARAMVRSDYDCGESSFVQDVTLYDKIPRIDFKMTVDWNENEATADVSFPTTLINPKASTEELLSGGSTVRSWSDITSRDYGISFLNDGSFPSVAGNSVLQEVFLTASAKPAIYEIAYSLYPHIGSRQNAHTSGVASELKSPLYAVSTTPHSGSLPKSESLISLSPSNLRVIFLRRSMDGKDLILTFRETDGTASKVSLVTSLPIKTYVRTNRLGRNIGEPKPMTKRTQLSIGKYGIITLRFGL